jgi:hypothetical protein
LPFVPRRQLGQIAPQIGQQFGKIVQAFLHDEVDNKVTLGNIFINPPCELDGIWCTKVQVWPSLIQYNDTFWHTKSQHQQQLVLPDVPMPSNVKSFQIINLRFACTFSNSNSSRIT